jgi:hypothetical protein
MKVRSLVFGGISAAIFGVSVSNIQMVIAAPAPLFKPVIKDIRNQLPKDMVVRLPAFVPDAEIKTYAVVRGYQGEYSDGFFAVDFASSPDCSVTACNLGNIFVMRSNPLKGEDGLLLLRPKWFCWL